MELSFQLNKDDYQAYARWGQTRLARAANLRSKLKVLGWLFYLLPPASLGMFLVSLGENGGHVSKPVIAAAALLVTWVGVLYAYSYRSQALVFELYVSPDSVAMQPQRLHLHEDGISASRPMATCEYRWGAIREVGKTEEHLYLVLDASQAFCIPCRVFKSPEDEVLFLDFAQEHISKARKQAE